MQADLVGLSTCHDRPDQKVTSGIADFLRRNAMEDWHTRQQMGGDGRWATLHLKRGKLPARILVPQRSEMLSYYGRLWFHPFYMLSFDLGCHRALLCIRTDIR